MLYFTAYFGPTNSRGSRIRVRNLGEEWGSRQSRFASYSYAAPCPHAQAVADVTGHPYDRVERLGSTDDGRGYVFRIVD